MKIGLSIIAFVIVITAGILSSCESASPVAQIPTDWKTVDKEVFVISLPPDMKEKKVQGVDTAVWEFNGPKMSLSIEAGMYAGDFSFERDRYESTVQAVTVNSVKADRIILDLNKPVLKNWSVNADGSTKVPNERENLVVGLYFPTKETKFWIERTPDVPQTTADIILNSVKFKE